MLPEHERALEKLRAAAEALLAHPRDAAARVTSRSAGLIELAIVTRPSFAPAVAVSVLRTPNRTREPSHIVCRVCWDQPGDHARLSSMGPVALQMRPPDPTIDVSVVEAPPQVAQWLTEARTLRIPQSHDCGLFGTDGESTTVQFGDLFHKSVWEWWGGGPDEWAPLVGWVTGVRGRLEALFDSPRA